MKLDAIDKKLLEHLQKDCKLTNKELSALLNLSITAIYERIKKLERSGVISQYVGLLDKSKVGRDFIVYCHIKLEKHKEEYLMKFEQSVMELEEVVECFHVSGDYDYIIKVLVADMASFREFMVTKLTSLAHVGSTQSSFVISEVKHTTAVSI
ncbi:Lrp/AsnC family transcriptional regulator [Dokdonia sinensis]|uniref:Lrp/AsnC family transcriptional regulator n=1 Tax=Dokdonia sinensis TaxID=2479847 RepID=A0A3M0G3N4_9FLAO|nr:Lrp/AsnC family transcriptional regulator [Dokdonia sinensis]RMB59554.1 Lrp/AsnC family transcriptional regulator [Dokdonia sinensis]